MYQIALGASFHLEVFNSKVSSEPSARKFEILHPSSPTPVSDAGLVAQTRLLSLQSRFYRRLGGRYVLFLKDLPVAAALRLQLVDLAEIEKPS